VAGGTKSVAALAQNPDAIHFLNEAFRHCKAIAADQDAIQVLEATYFGAKKDNNKLKDDGVLVEQNINTLIPAFIKAIAAHRFWEREAARKVPA